MYLQISIFTVFMLLTISDVSSQEIAVSITLTNTQIVEECHFGDDWNAYFGFNGKYKYSKQGDKFLLKPNEKFSLKSMVFEGNEEYGDYAEKTAVISYEQLEVGRYTFEELLYVEDENTGRYHCNNATFKFTYLIEVSLR